MIGLMPAFVDAVTDADRAARMYRVRIPGLTDGATSLPRAQVLNPLGDKSEHTEIRIKPGDRVWLAFEGGDTRYPVIVGFRPKNQENAMDWRRFEHANFEFNADNTFQVIAGTQCIVRTPLALVDANNTHVTGDVQIDGNATVNGLLTYKGGMKGSGGSGASAQIEGGITATGDIKVGNISLEGHTHGDPQGGTVGTPQ
jgi:phage baseplate assembly protein gpV